MSMSLFSSPWLGWDSWTVWKSSYSEKWVGRQRKNIFTHHMCFEKILSLISTDALTRYSVVLIQLIWYIYIIILYIYNMYMYVWLCMYMQIKGRVAVMRRQQKIESQRTSTVLGDWRGSAGKVDVPHPHHALWACDLQWRFSQDQNTT